MYWQFMVGVVGLAIAGLGLFASGTMGVASYFFDEPVWFSVLVVAGLLQMAAAWALVTGRYGRLALGGLAPALAIGAYAVAQSGDWNLMLAEVALTVLVVTARHDPVATSSRDTTQH
jgi:hypothetical protein